MHDKTIKQMLDELAKGAYSSEELTRHFLDRIAERNEDYNCYLTVMAEEALAKARNTDESRARGEQSILSGIPIAHKDIFCTKGTRTTAGSQMLDNFIAPYDATVVENLARAGAVTLGKTNMDEFAMGSSNETSFYGPVNNPWDTNKVPGGSSGGSAAAVAGRLCAGSTGTDTGGSIRQPAALCGLTGLKPTYGRVSRWGMIAFASSLDQAGPLTQTAEDAALMLQAMAGFDTRDSTSLDKPVPDYMTAIEQPIKGLKIGVVKEYFDEGLDAGVQQAVQESIRVLEKEGAQIKELSLPNTRYSVPAYYVIAPAECSSNLSRYDGVRFGYRCANPKNLDDLYKRSRSEAFGREVKRRVMVGTFALSAGYYDAYYKKAQKIRRLIQQDFIEAFSQVDVLLGPTAPAPAFNLGEKSEDQIAMYLQDIYTIASNLAGTPAISIPTGLVDGLPVGLQLIGNYLREDQILQVAHQFQLKTDWHNRIPASALSEKTK